jgi:hypothetical protein
LEAFGGFWRLLEAFGGFWRLLEAFGGCSNLIAGDRLHGEGRIPLQIELHAGDPLALRIKDKETVRVCPGLAV